MHLRFFPLHLLFIRSKVWNPDYPIYVSTLYRYFVRFCWMKKMIKCALTHTIEIYKKAFQPLSAVCSAMTAEKTEHEMNISLVFGSKAKSRGKRGRKQINKNWSITCKWSKNICMYTPVIFGNGPTFFIPAPHRIHGLRFYWLAFPCHREKWLTSANLINIVQYMDEVGLI